VAPRRTRRAYPRLVTPRGTDWGLAGLVALGLASAIVTWFAGAAWIVAAHDALGLALAALVVVKLRRVGRPRGLGGAALLLVAGVLLSGVVWSTAGFSAVAGYTVLAWHALLGAVLGAGVLLHARVRAKRPRSRDVLDRRQFLTAAAMGAGALGAWWAQRTPGLPGARRRFTGSYDAGAAFPVTSWVADSPRPLGGGYRLAVAGLVARPLSLEAGTLDRGDELVATLDCTGGFYTTQRWRGTTLGRLLDEAGVGPEASHVRVISHTGYRWSFGLAEARGLLLATHVAGAALSHGHGAPARLVAPGHRGWHWVKWVERIEVHAGPDAGALASTVLSSLS
jgi:DMSO/TMAO reductase YedYZ molybdopterin-dependent catalytic subunit